MLFQSLRFSFFFSYEHFLFLRRKQSLVLWHLDIFIIILELAYLVNLGKWIHLRDCPPFSEREITSVTSCLLPW